MVYIQEQVIAIFQNYHAKYNMGLLHYIPEHKHTKSRA